MCPHRLAPLRDAGLGVVLCWQTEQAQPRRDPLCSTASENAICEGAKVWHGGGSAVRRCASLSRAGRKVGVWGSPWLPGTIFLGWSGGMGRARAVGDAVPLVHSASPAEQCTSSHGEGAEGLAGEDGEEARGTSGVAQTRRRASMMPKWCWVRSPRPTAQCPAGAMCAHIFALAGMPSSLVPSAHAVVEGATA